MNVNLSNVLNNLALDLKIEKANIPINAQIPINIAANVCGVSINVLSIGAGGGIERGLHREQHLARAQAIHSGAARRQRIGRRRRPDDDGYDEHAGTHHDNATRRPNRRRSHAAPATTTPQS